MDIAKKYIDDNLKNKNTTWEDILLYYGCVNENGEKLGAACVFEKAVTNSKNPDKIKSTYMEDIKHFKPRANKYIPRGQGTPISELNQLMEQIKELYPEMEVYYVPLVKCYKNYHTPDILQVQTSPLTHYVKNGKRMFVQPLLTGNQLSNGKHWVLLFVDMRDSK
jgi:hypothetical protein